MQRNGFDGSDSSAPANSPATEQHFTVQQVAEMWAMSEHSVYRLFEDEPGVLKFSFPRLLKSKAKRAPRTSLRIPQSVLARVHEQRSGGFAVQKGLRRG
jgi:predicted DNA-binding transcriptional regulator AlpA